MNQLSKLEQLRAVTTVVADTGEIEAIKYHRPVDATTNPSLLLKAAQNPQYSPLLDQAIAWAMRRNDDKQQRLVDAMDRLAVNFGTEILKLIPGRVSVEVDARLSFDTVATAAKARKIIAMFDQVGITPDRVLIKIAATWEGIRAAEILEREGINCNLTLLFGFSQARACAEAGVFLISPFVGRILDWYKKNTEQKEYTAEQDPGVRSVKRIYQYYKEHGYKTVVMGASFRNLGEIEALAGCDRLTISPTLLEELASSRGELAVKLTDTGTRQAEPEPIAETAFRWQMNEDAMATEKLAEGIRGFATDQQQLETIVAARI